MEPDKKIVIGGVLFVLLSISVRVKLTRHLWSTTMKYDWILFDADETLFSFDAFKGLKTMFARLGVDFTEQDFSEYQHINKPLWVRYQNGEISAAQLQQDRFLSWAERLSTTALELNRLFLEAMADICQVLPGVKELLDLIGSKAQLGIITNGFTQLQQIRLEKTGLSEYFQHVIISEEIGVAKPDRAIFDFALDKMGQPDRNKVLMVGDNVHSDVLGGLNAGVETCWINWNQDAKPEHIDPHFQVTDWFELKQLLIA